jgi:hypothetical protein
MNESYDDLSERLSITFITRTNTIADAIEKLKSVRLTKLFGYVAILVDSNGIMLVDHTSMVYEVFNRSNEKLTHLYRSLHHP